MWFKKGFSNGFEEKYGIFWEMVFQKDLEKSCIVCSAFVMIFEIIFKNDFQKVWKRNAWFAKVLENDFRGFEGPRPKLLTDGLRTTDTPRWLRVNCLG